MGDLFVLSWARVRRVRRGSLSSEMLMCGGGVCSIMFLTLVARCLETVFNAAFCMTCSLIMLVEDARGDHMEEAYSRAGLITVLYVAMSVSFYLPHTIAVSDFIICRGDVVWMCGFYILCRLCVPLCSLR